MNRNLGTQFKAWAARTTTNILHGKDGLTEVTVGGVDGAGNKVPKAIPMGSSAPKTQIDYSPKTGYGKPRYPGPSYRM